MRMLWTVFFLGSLLFIGVDTMDRRQSSVERPDFVATAGGDAVGMPTPRP